jgi:molybdopterin synthase catalytic subunit
MDIQGMIQKARAHPEAGKIGMIASHLGIVRATSRDGKPVEEIQVSYDHEILVSVIRDIKDLPGIVEVLVDIREGTLEIGDEILAVVVAGDIRENVFHALITAVNRIKGEASRKNEIRKG